MKAHYSVVIQWSEEDSCYIASIPEFCPYALTHGSTYHDALALDSAQEVLQLLIDTTSPLPYPHTFQSSNMKVA